MAAVVGTLLGVGVAYGMVLAMARALGSFGIEIGYSVTWRSIVLAYALGVLLTLVVVTVSAWRVSVLNIASAVRNLPEPGRQEKKRRWLRLLRSIGFQRRMIQASFLLESSFVALTAIVVGTLLGLVISYNVIADAAEQPSWGDTLTFSVPWLSLVLIFLVVYAVSLATTLAPALRASRVYPAEALRYQ